jgi:S-DNA-T family DNA segregation ATPase FtsK/SpoIIIE
MNSLIISLLYKARPEEVKLIMIDPKMVELGVYNGIPHLYIPVVTDPKKAAGALQWAVVEMLKRYRLFSEVSVRDISSYNEHQKGRRGGDTLPRVVM